MGPRRRVLFKIITHFDRREARARTRAARVKYAPRALVELCERRHNIVSLSRASRRRRRRRRRRCRRFCRRLIVARF